ncbi:hypothetical protein GO013_01555 [Pseudodesulfovibrio sp. JC047]|uniref:hypothetical protein n=1 Tax=Pseudodesulfovibrio sp. JC047 TaxID=2683199 RepID=UPI0013D8D83C|nr:hypothetical protein [Pseudodesulfovibrio sp. JC047]NDV18103.1 hypothetical protein [Pseudodesulfovibrio sp. JC047]
MSSSMKWCVGICLMLLFVPGCVKNEAIKLTYALAGTTTRCQGDVVVFKFEDRRPVLRLGRTLDNSSIATVSDVADWVGWAVFDELKNAGCSPKYRTSTVMPGDAVLVTGEVLDVELNQTGTTTYAGKVSVKIIMSRAGQTMHIQKYTSEVENVVIPGYSTPSDILAEALRGVMTEAIPTISAIASSPM